MKNILLIIGLVVSIVACGQTNYVDLEVKSTTSGSDGHTIFDGTKGRKMTHTVLFNNTDDSLASHLQKIEDLEDTTASHLIKIEALEAGGANTFENMLTESGGTVKLGGTATGDTYLNVEGESTTLGIRSTYTSNDASASMVLSEGEITIRGFNQDDYNSSSGYSWLSPGGGGITMGYQDGATDVKTVTVSNSAMLVLDEINSKGLENTADYSANSTDRSLIDKAEIEALIAAGVGDQLLDLNTETGTSYTFDLADKSMYITLTNAAAITLTVPPNSSEAFELGTQITIEQGGAGQVTITPGGGVTIQSADTKLKTRVQFSVVTFIKKDTDVWTITGDTAL